MTPPFDNFNPATTQWNINNARALAYASNLAYQADANAIKQSAQAWGFAPDRITTIAPTSSVLQAIILGRKDAVVLAFRGTRPDELIDWMADCEIVQVPFSDYFASPNVGAVHEGFCRLLTSGWKNILAEVTRLQDSGQTLWITGHSLGGALALMATAAFTFSARLPVNGLYTFGQPRVGDIDFCTQCDSHFGNVMFRFVNNEDIVTRVPPRVVPGLPLPSFYGHSGQIRFFDGDGKLHDDDHWWNAFLINVEVGFEKMKQLLAGPVADHCLACVPNGYIARIEQNIV
jgi:triacylglycerol lipase